MSEEWNRICLELQTENARLRAAFVDAENELDAKHAKLVEVADKLASERAAHEATKAKLQAAEQRVAELEAIKPLLDAEALYSARERVAELERENAELSDALKDYDAWTDDLEPPDVLVHWRADRAALSLARERVAELERDIGSVNNEWQAETMRKLKAEAALSSARELLESADQEAKANPRYMLRTKEIGFDAALRLLRAHHEPATTEREHPEAKAIRQRIVDESLRTLGLHMPATPAATCTCEHCPQCLERQRRAAVTAATGAETFTTRHGDVIDISEKERKT